MLKAILFAWLCLPLGFGLYHWGPGQERLRADVAGDAVERGNAAAERARAQAEAEGDEAARATWAEAERAYTQALDSIPIDEVDTVRRVRLERAKTQMFISQLPEARRDLGALVAELEADPDVDEALVLDAHEALANAQYYTTWLMRLEDEPRDVWEPEVEAARQNYKLAAESWAELGRTTRAEAAAENVESSIRLARMELTELQGLPLPSQ